MELKEFVCDYLIDLKMLEGLLITFIYLVFDLDQTLLDLFKVCGYTGEWVEKGHIVPVHAYIRVLCKRLGFNVKTSGKLTNKKGKKSKHDRNYVKKSVLVVIELLAEIMDTIIYNGGKGGSLINGLFNSDRINLNKLKDSEFVKSVKFLEPLVTKFFDALEKSGLTFEDVISITNKTLTAEERLFFSQCSRKAMPKQNSEKYIALFNIFLDIEKHNAITDNKTKILIGMFSAGDGYMFDFLKQSGLERFFQFAVDFGSENELRGAFDFQDENGTYPNVKCKPDPETFKSVDVLILESITNYCTKNVLQMSEINKDIKVKMIDDNPKVCLATTEYGKISQLMWEPVNIEKITSVGKSENPTKGTLFYTQNQIVDLIKGLLSSV